MKTCTACRQAKPPELFHRASDSKDGRKKRCADCVCSARMARYYANQAAEIERGREYKAANRDGMNARRRAVYAMNKERESARSKAYRAKNLDRLKAQVNAYKAANKEKVSAYRRDHKVQNPHLNRANQQRRKAQELRATPIWADIDAIRAVYAQAVEVERLTGEPQHVDHIVPLKGRTVCGLHVHWNLRVIPATENVRKSNKLLAELAA